MIISSWNELQLSLGEVNMRSISLSIEARKGEHPVVGIRTSVTTNK